MLASPAVRGTRLFETALEARGLFVIWPKDDDAMLTAIRAIKVEGPTTAVRQILWAASQELAAAGGMLQLVACSEFSLIADSVAPNVSAVDTVDLLARKIIKFAQAGLQEEAV